MMVMANDAQKGTCENKRTDLKSVNMLLIQNCEGGGI